MEPRNDPKLKTPIFFALDVDDPAEALKLAREVKPYIDAVKVGPRLTLRMAESQWKELKSLHKVFWDHKYLDITSTMVEALEATLEKGASWATVHALAGPDTLDFISRWEEQAQRSRPFQVLVVTLLTSFSKDNLPHGLKGLDPAELVFGLVQEAYDRGLRGFVCSPHEVKELKEKFPEGFFVTPGVRLPGKAAHDQKRVMSPKDALNEGSSALVMGRSLLELSTEERASFLKEVSG